MVDLDLDLSVWVVEIVVKAAVLGVLVALEGQAVVDLAAGTEMVAAAVDYRWVAAVAAVGVFVLVVLVRYDCRRVATVAEVVELSSVVLLQAVVHSEEVDVVLLSLDLHYLAVGQSDDTVGHLVAAAVG